MPARNSWSIGTLRYTTLGLVALFFWLLWGDFTLDLKNNAITKILPPLFKRYSTSDTLVGVLFGSLPSVVVILISPIVGYKSDRHRGRLGRRIPFLLIPLPFAVAAMVGLAYSPTLGMWLFRLLPATTSANAAIICSITFFWLVFEVASIISGGVIGALNNDVIPHEVMGRFCALFRMVALVANIIFSVWLFGLWEEHYTEIFLGTALLYGLSFTFVCLKVKEGRYPPPPPLREGGTLPAIKTYVRDSFTSSYYVWLFSSIALANMAFACINNFTVFFAMSVGVDMRHQYGKLAAIQLTLSLIQSFPIGWLADRFHPLRLTIVSLVVFGTMTLLAFVFVRDAKTFSVAMVLVGTSAGFWATSFAPLAPLLLPREKYAQFSSAMDIYVAIGRMVVGLACGLFLDAVGHNYRYIYLWAFVFTTLSLFGMIVVYRKFREYGGIDHYSAPDPGRVSAAQTVCPIVI